MTRRYLTAREKEALIAAQGDVCAICRHVLHGRAQFDHSTPHAFRPERKPDQAICVPCHLEKTRKDVKAIAKAKRLAGERKPRIKRPIRSRGFDKTLRKRMSGEVVRVAA